MRYISLAAASLAALSNLNNKKIPIIKDYNKLIKKVSTRTYNHI